MIERGAGLSAGPSVVSGIGFEIGRHARRAATGLPYTTYHRGGYHPPEPVGPPYMAAAQWRPGLPEGAYAAGAPISSQRNGGKEGAGRGISISPAPAPHPLKRPIRGACGPPYWMYPPSCSTGSFPAAKAYVVTPSPLRAGQEVSAGQVRLLRRLKLTAGAAGRPGAPGWPGPTWPGRTGSGCCSWCRPSSPRPRRCRGWWTRRPGCSPP